MKTRKIDAFEMIRFQAIASATARELPPSIAVRETKIGALRVTPINGNPYVVDFNNQTVTVFEVEPASGTDKIRQSIRAAIYFDGIPEQVDLLRAA